jgi:hypothetical protein
MARLIGPRDKRATPLMASRIRGGGRGVGGAAAVETETEKNVVSKPGGRV